jgi:hypothetical protein
MNTQKRNCKTVKIIHRYPCVSDQQESIRLDFHLEGTGHVVETSLFEVTTRQVWDRVVLKSIIVN